MEILEEGEKSLRARVGSDDYLLARALLSLGRTYQAIGEFDRAERHLEEARDIARSRLAPDDELTLRTRGALAALYRDQARHEEAEREWLAVLEVHRRLGAVSTDFENLPDMYLDLGRADEAREILDEHNCQNPHQWRGEP